MWLVSECVAVLMPAGSGKVVSAPTHTCASLSDQLSLTFTKPEIP